MQATVHGASPSSLWSVHQRQEQLLREYRSQIIANATRLHVRSNEAERQEGHLEEFTCHPIVHHPMAAFPGGGDAATAMILSGSFLGCAQAGSSLSSSAALMRGSSVQANTANVFDLLWSMPTPTTSILQTLQPNPLSNQPISSHLRGEDVATDYIIPTLPARELPPKELPTILALPEDRLKLSPRQVFLRHQIEVFVASEEDVSTYTRGRNKRITIGQVGIRCRHCAHVSVVMRQKGSVYFPATLLGLYQAAQNMNAIHLQCGLCSHAPMEIKRHFAALMLTKSLSLGSGRPYWAQAAEKLGLVDTDEGISFAPGIRPTPDED